MTKLSHTTTIYTDGGIHTVSRYLLDDACLLLLQVLHQTEDIIINHMNRVSGFSTNAYMLVTLYTVCGGVQYTQYIHVFSFNRELDPDYIKFTEYTNRICLHLSKN